MTILVAVGALLLAPRPPAEGAEGAMASAEAGTSGAGPVDGSPSALPSDLAAVAASPPPPVDGVPPAASPGVAPGGPFPHGLLIADRGNGRILAVDNAGRTFWRFPVRGSLPGNLPFAADDAFVAPDGRTIVANDEYHQVIYRIDIRTRRVIWQYGHFGVPGAGNGYLHNPDDAYPLANGDIVVADIINCRVIEIAPDKRIVRTLGVAGVCADDAPTTYGDPNGDTPLPDGGLLITEIRGSRVVRLSPSGKVLFDIHIPVAYPSDAQLDRRGNVVVVDYSSPGSVVVVTPGGRVVWRWSPTAGRARMDHPSLGTPLPNGDIVINDDARDRIIVLDPRTRRIVWQYGRTDAAGTAAGYLSDPDGNMPIPANAVF
ncbi:MAG TPA: PQQ-binding-like beta-propeller repeat protein [Acidimicrobiales bacterium]|nr:PQQ-binding-like beta-propeller repeat protein [Acidimicrobiales bacterium]